MLETISEHKSFGGTVGYYRHASTVNNCNMQFSVFVPPHRVGSRLPILTYLAGLTCNEETFMIKAGAQRHAAEHGLILVAADTSPRGTDVPDDEAWDLGQGAGFYVDATEPPWKQYFNMYSYVTRELPDLMASEFAVDTERQGIFGHSMGGHGALVVALRNPGRLKSVSAFAPICAPSRCPWGQKAFSQYLGKNENDWAQFDAVTLMRQCGDTEARTEMLVDQGTYDQFLNEQLHPELLEEAALAVGYPLTLRRHEGYDHGYFFIASFIKEHIRFHAKHLQSSGQ